MAAVGGSDVGNPFCCRGLASALRCLGLEKLARPEFNLRVGPLETVEGPQPQTFDTPPPLGM